MYHTSPIEITEGTINTGGIARDCLFFSDDVYTMTENSKVYIYESDFDCVRASQLYDE